MAGFVKICGKANPMKLKLPSLVFVTIFLLHLIPLWVNGQVLEHTYNTGRGDNAQVFNSTNGIKYLVIDSAQTNVKVYNRQHVLERSFNLPARPSGFQSAPFFIRTFFDALVPGEVVIVMWYYASVAGRTINYVRMIDHNGLIRLDLPDFAGGWIYSDPGNPPVFVCSKTTIPTEWRIYRLPGTMVNLPVQGTSKAGSRAFPSPTSDRLNIELGASLSGHERVLEVFDLKGQLVNKVIVPADAQFTEIDTRSWAPGVYQYSVQGSEPIEGRFIVEK